MGFGAAVKPPTRTQTRELELELELLVEGMMCQKNCGATVENALRGVEGVSSAVVSFEQRQAAMTLRRPGSATLQELVDEVGCVGFEAGAYDAVKAAAVKLQAQRQQNIQQQEKSLDVRDAASRRKADVAFGRDMVPSARQTQLIQDAGDDDSLELKVTVAGMSGAACVGKIEAAVGALPGVSKNYKRPHFFQSSALLLTFVTLSNYMESMAEGKTADALSELAKLQLMGQTPLYK
ncbi:hypothetical protein PF011_g24498 [Phytophthora fragariae]|uniref:HMA domain-containing protein n=1 Tax=Phytophthora fragariae TaxID=53985 RepID=A0A6A3HXI5_9STRA|nr:hypothetical protein PF011_g24498 [Phytophthora fragariae]